MIVCHCNILTCIEIEDTIDALLIADPSRRLTPGMVYRDLGRRGRCCGCFPAIVALIVAAVDARCPEMVGADAVGRVGDAAAAE